MDLPASNYKNSGPTNAKEHLLWLLDGNMIVAHALLASRFDWQSALLSIVLSLRTFKFFDHESLPSGFC
ncbi:hypothetical protein U9M48_019513 [Paspalum notatum var. saurae]|uniref:Uncharacterized protein n=1 Tax=Paspalum notatum var. saurae TaxID=547442 RepID=A0AAQ3TCD2_PASNO